MLRSKLIAADKSKRIPQEGELYTRIEYDGRTFDIHYGYYEECDRQNPLVDPVPVYPDFISVPMSDSEGSPFCTEMQDACRHYAGPSLEDGCFSCKYYRRAVDRIGICSCQERRLE